MGRPRLKDEPVSFRPEIHIRLEMDNIAGRAGVSVSEWVESIITREVLRAAAAQGTTSEDDRSASV